jgi:subtilisin family serine protease
VGGEYASGSGTSYAAPVLAGVVAGVWSVNPALRADEVLELLKRTATDLGAPGWDRYFGWGRVRYGVAMVEAAATRPRLGIERQGADTVVLSWSVRSGLDYDVWWTPSVTVPMWEVVTPVNTVTQALELRVTVPAPGQLGAFRLETTRRVAGSRFRALGSKVVGYRLSVVGHEASGADTPDQPTTNNR